MKMDNRDEVDAIIYMMRRARTELVLKTLTITIIFVIIALLITVLVSHNIITPMLVYLLYKYIIIMFNIKRVTCIANRQNYIKTLVLIITRVLNPFRLTINSIITSDDIDAVLLTEIDKEISKNNIQWDELDKELKHQNEYTIDDYWIQLGLNSQKIQSSTKAVRIEAREPLSPKLEEDYCMSVILYYHQYQ
jgi:hypothetical protein